MKDRGEPVLKELRNKEIVRLIDEQKVTKTAIAKWFGITKQRVHQIYLRETGNVSNIRTPGNGEDNDATQ